MTAEQSDKHSSGPQPDPDEATRLEKMIAYYAAEIPSAGPNPVQAEKFRNDCIAFARAAAARVRPECGARLVQSPKAGTVKECPECGIIMGKDEPCQRSAPVSASGSRPLAGLLYECSALLEQLDGAFTKNYAMDFGSIMRMKERIDLLLAETPLSTSGQQVRVDNAVFSLVKWFRGHYGTEGTYPGRGMVEELAEAAAALSARQERKI